MSFLRKLRPGAGTQQVAIEPMVVEDSLEKMESTSDVEAHNPENVTPDQNAQRGVQEIEAVTLVWTKTSLAALLICIWVLFLVNGFRINILATLLPYVTSSFESHSLLTVITIVASAMTGAVYIPMAKMMDLWGRAEAFLFMVVLSTLGLILMAASRNLAMYCAAEVFYSVGFAGLIYSICVFATDVTNLRNRGLAFAFTSSPYMITAFAGSKAAEGFLEHVSWRWGFGCFAIIVPVVTAPLYMILKVNLKKAKRQGLVSDRPDSTPQTLIQKVWWAIKEFDLMGVFLFAAGLVIFLLPFNLAASAPHGWKSGYIIAMIVVGFVLLVIFAVHQVYLAPVPFLKHSALVNRTVIGACLIDMTYQISYYCWDSYFTSFLQVVNNVSAANAGYINSTFQVVSGVLLFIVGYLIRRTGYFKWTFYWAIPLYTFTLGLMIYFRRPNQSIGYLVMCEIFISMGGSVFILNCQLAVLAAVEHQYVAAVLSLLFVSGSIGDSVGSAICGAIWTNTFESALIRYLPETALADAAEIYASITVQLSYPVGSPVRLAIQEAYGYAQTRMLAAGTGIMALCFIWVLFIENLNVSKLTQTRGVVL
ncbi:unnamed protein product [Peniophora sp. CBMAI 1063]|nr:unnamed protein product [Peniophora sp. CBMAI 1063]